jgi:hypothetical protein
MKTSLVSNDVEKIIDEITISWNKAASYIVEVSLLIHKYQSDKSNKELWREVRDTLIDRKIMSRTIISNLYTIGQKQVLINNTHLLPPAYNTLWELARLPDDELNRKFDEKLINPQLKLEEVRKWKLLDKVIDVDYIEIDNEESNLKGSINIYFTEDEIINNHVLIGQKLEEIRSLFDNSTIKLSGLLKRKIEGD